MRIAVIPDAEVRTRVIAHCEAVDHYPRERAQETTGLTLTRKYCDECEEYTPHYDGKTCKRCSR